MTLEEARKRAREQLGPKFDDADDATLLSGCIVLTEEATAQFVKLSSENEALQAQVTELSASKVEPAIVELSATEKRLIGENTALKIEAIAGKQQWSTAYTQKVKDLFAGDSVVALSASGVDDAVPAKFLDLLAEQPVKGLDGSGKEKTPAQIKLSREASDDDKPKDDSANPLLDTAKAMAAK